MPANIYEQLGVRTLINANATLTRLGGSIMPKQVVDAMAEASKHYINLDELQIKVSERLAQITHNEVGLCGNWRGCRVDTGHRCLYHRHRPGCYCPIARPDRTQK